MECDFVVGQKVACVKDCGSDHWVKSIKSGDILTVREVTLARRNNGKEMVGLRFAEVVNPCAPYSCWEYDYSPTNFKPVVERKTDISIFKAMLTPSKEQVSA